MVTIALATDFGDGPYVGQMKAVIGSRAPRARIVDLFHTVSPQCVLESSFLLSKTWRFFPPGSIFVSVVDPGVGSSRKVLAVRAWRHVFLAPDNGILSFIPKMAVHDIRVVENRKYFLTPVSDTFHGRDIFSPVAAALAEGAPFSSLGRKAGDFHRTTDLLPTRIAGGWEGKVAHIDRFGNVVTNLPVSHPVRRLRIAKKNFATLVRTYTSAPRRRPVVLKGSFGTWEIAIRNGNAARSLSLRVGAPVRQES